MGKRFTIFISVILLVSLFLCSCAGETVEPTQSDIEPPIPDNYLTYTDENGTFSISYPPEWELLINLIANGEQDMRQYLKSIDEDLPVERASVIFLAGFPLQEVYTPAVVIIIEPLYDDISGIDEVFESAISSFKEVANDYNEISKNKTVIDGKEAIIVHHMSDLPDIGNSYFMNMVMVVDKNVWAVTFSASSEEEYSKWEEDFINIARSLRILK